MADDSNSKSGGDELKMEVKGDGFMSICETVRSC
jgi:hypothetical protein